MSIVIWGVFILLAGCCGLVLGAMLGANKRSELEDEIARLQRRLFARPAPDEEHA